MRVNYAVHWPLGLMAMGTYLVYEALTRIGFHWQGLLLCVPGVLIALSGVAMFLRPYAILEGDRLIHPTAFLGKELSTSVHAARIESDTIDSLDISFTFTAKMANADQWKALVSALKARSA